jgi:hypothetical protein
MPRYVRNKGPAGWEGADHQNGPWRPIPAPQSGLPWPTDGPAVQSREPAAVAAEARPLSPAAQAVLDAFWKQPGDRSAIAAALRAVADQVVPDSVGPLHRDRDVMQWEIRRKLLAIAAKLEGSDA